MAKRFNPNPHTSIVKHVDGYHITHRTGDGYGAVIDEPYFSANHLGYFRTQDEAQTEIDNYRFDQLSRHTPEAASAVVWEIIEREAA